MSFIERFKQRKSESPTVTFAVEFAPSFTWEVSRFSPEERAGAFAGALAYCEREGVTGSSRAFEVAFALKFFDVLKRHVVSFKHDSKEPIESTTENAQALLSEMDMSERSDFIRAYNAALEADSKSAKKKAKLGKKG